MAELQSTEIKQTPKDKSSVKPSTTKTKPTLTRKFFRSFVNARSWTSYDELSNNIKNVISWYRKLFGTKNIQPQILETFEEAIARLGLTQQQLESRKKNFLYFTITYLAMAAAFLIYAIYLILNIKIFYTIIVLFLVAFYLALAYREHFWYMQVKLQKLGCTFQDWKRFVTECWRK